VTETPADDCWTPRGAGVLVALATYNERDNLPTLVAEIHRRLPDALLLVVDDDSPDGTGRWCAAFAAEHPWFRCLHRPGKLGLGSAAWLAMQTAQDLDCGALVTLDADWSHPPDALPRLLAAAADADVAIGSRYCPGGSVHGWPLSRRLISAVVNECTRAVVGVGVRDASTAYRCYRVSALRKIDLRQLRASGYAYLEEILAALHAHGARIVEIPIAFSDRRAGASKAGAAEAWGKCRVLLGLALRRLFRLH